MKIFKKFILEQQLMDLETTLRSKGYTELKRLSSTRYAVLTDENREQVLNKLLSDLAEFNPQLNRDSKLSSVGQIDIYPNFVIIVKPKSKQGMGAPGLDNESKLSGKINEYCNLAGTPIKVIFKGKNKDFVCEEVISSEEVGRKTKKSEKADIKIVGKKDYNISLKKDNAVNWESADKTFKNKALKLIREYKDKIKLFKINSYYKIKPTIAIEMKEEEAKKVIFGTDLKEGSGCVVIKTFNDSDFKFNETSNELEIICSHIIESMSDVKDEEYPYLYIRNDKTRKVGKFIPGLRILAVYKSRIDKNNIIKIKSS